MRDGVSFEEYHALFDPSGGRMPDEPLRSSDPDPQEEGGGEEEEE